MLDRSGRLLKSIAGLSWVMEWAALRYWRVSAALSGDGNYYVCISDMARLWVLIKVSARPLHCGWQGWEKMPVANLHRPTLEGFCIKVDAIICNQGLWYSFMTKQLSRSLKSEVSISFRRKKDFRPLGIGIHHHKSIAVLQERTTIIGMHSLSWFVDMGEWFHLGNPEVTWMDDSENWDAQRLRDDYAIIHAEDTVRAERQVFWYLKYSWNCLLVLYCQPGLRDILLKRDDKHNLHFVQHTHTVCVKHTV